MKLTGNPRGVQLVILLLLIATVWFSCRSAKAEPAFFAGAGAAMRGSHPYSGGLRFGMEQGVWQASVVTMGEGGMTKPDGRYIVEANLGGCGTFHRAWKRLSIGWGACLWEHGDFSIGDKTIVTRADGLVMLDDDGVQLTAAIILRRTFGKNEHYYVELFHASTGGSTHYNAGRNLIGAGVRF